MNPPPAPTPQLFLFQYNDEVGMPQTVTVQGYQYETGTYFLFLPDGGILAMSMEATGYVRITPVPQGNDSSTVGGPAQSEQAEDSGWFRSVPASRWQLL